MKLKVPSIACDNCVAGIEREIRDRDPNAKVEGDVSQKILTIETEMTEAAVKEAIVAAGHEVG
ncbi:cation transporter [Lusitaniella coriacea LEGE 07157]|uniref:Cation transporter n=1 Tax=Lusitaniella coriacea LEGE 07157 TaxID=945747 RepID=A0A8J7J6H9_9CYAN|nr:cation transporter [Lusitaniella coriacea]MBE9118714.1 cation transporter [Lusitaniella coriacea LEGE 07157]